ncbi:MFS transporter [Hoyosella sp. G463]|uniref:MFS transporter n=1 Tax=Lolliginicoccus lacisalsi TaxID=2742202 RepID=A0A927PML5_9ACTN|nr:MFS transporter [Lolliginicoccus lacisalsi]MBD8506526.1 MFS transporter [Lolliginicoccus lacisalsi]
MTTTTPLASPGAGTQRDRRWLVLAVLGIAQLMVVLDATIVNIALPAAQADLGFTDSDRQWVIIAYALTFGSLLLLGGRLSDLFGRRVTFLTGLVGFAAASAVGGLAPSFEILVAARAGQGIFGALLAPTALALLTTTFTDPKERAKAFGIFGAIAGSGAGVGLLLGGVLTEWADWRWTLLVNVFFAGVALIGAAILLDPQRSTTRPRLDIPGTLVGSVALFAIVFGFSSAEHNGWTATSTLAWIATGVVGLAAFVYLQNRVEHPLLPLKIILDRTRGAAFLSMFLAGSGMFAVFLFLTYYLQVTVGYSPIRTGLAFLPMVMMIMISSIVINAVLLPKHGPRPLVTTGMMLGALGLAWLTQIEIGSSYLAHILPSLVIMGLGMGAIFASSIQSAVSGVAPADAGIASATMNTMQQVGGSIGTALLSTLAATAASDYLAGGGSGGAVQAAMESYTTAFAWGAGIFVIGAIVAGTLFRTGQLPAQQGAPVVAH